MRKVYLLFFFLWTTCVLAQDKKESITAEFSNLTAEQFAKRVESLTDYKFYFLAKDFDSLRVNLSVQQEPVSSVLTKAFSGTDFHYLIRDKQVFLTRARALSADLPSQFLKYPPSAPVAGIESFADLIPGRLDNVSTLENKVYQVGIATANPGTGNVRLSGMVRNFATGSPLPNTEITIGGSNTPVKPDKNGFYSIMLPLGRNEINIKSPGMKDTRRILMLYSTGSLDIALQDQVHALEEVSISASAINNVKSAQMGVARLDIATIRRVPSIFGEADVMKVVLTLPGVKSAGEASSGFNVRGGAVDQNLVMFNNATIYNPSHFFGFFSAFNPDLVKNIELYKSSIPSRFGGRLASVLDVESREGSKEKFTGTAGLGLITSRVSVEGPIAKGKSSFIFGGRTTYSNWLLQSLPSKSGYRDAKASFYDFNLNLSQDFGASSNLLITGYLSHDQSNLGMDTTFGYQNANVNARLKHSFNAKFSGVLSAGADNYGYENSSDHTDKQAYKLTFGVNQYNAKLDFNYNTGGKHTFGFGAGSIYYQLDPGNLNPFNTASLVTGDIVPNEQGIESSAYISDQIEISPKLAVDLGLRYSVYQSMGPRSLTLYQPGQPREEATVIGSTAYGPGKVMKTYGGPEYRFSARYSVSDDFSVKAAYNTSRQYIHLLTNSSSASPTDIWKLSDPNIKPQLGEHYSFGLFKNFSGGRIESSVETYYKKMHHYLDYKSGAQLVLNHHIERDVLNSEGKAYGIEFLIKKPSGKFNGWVSYTYSRTFLRTDDKDAGQDVNNGSFYPANVDKPNDFSFVGNYRFLQRFSGSLNMVYSTGRPITLPVGRYYYENRPRVLYSQRNAYRIADYFRMDLSFNIEGNHNLTRKIHDSWTFGMYNLTGKKNPYSNFFATENGAINGYKLIIFGSPVPFVNYNLRF